MNLKNKDILLVPILIIAGKLLSFVFNAFLGSYYGAGKISDAFIIAHTIPTILFEGVATAFISCYIPIQRTLIHNSPERIDDFNSNMTSISVLLSVVVTVIYYLFHHQINSVYAHGFDEISLGLLDKYSSILVWSIPFIGAYCIFRAHLQVSEKKTVSSLGQAILYIVLIISVLGFYPNDTALSWATLIGNIICFCIFIFYAARSGYRYRPYISFNKDYIKTMLLMIFPIFFSTLAAELASIVDKYFASQYSDGIITSLTYGYQLSFAMQGIVSVSVLIVVFPNLSDKAALGDYLGMNSIMYKCIELISWVIMPIVAGGIVLSKPIISIMFGHGKFSENSVNITALVFSGYLFGVLPMCIKHVGDRVCFAMKKTKLAMITTFITVGSNILLDYVMNTIWGYIGLVIATGIAIMIGMTFCILLIKNENKNLSIRRILMELIRPTILAVFMGIVVYFIHIFLIGIQVSNFTTILLCFVIGIIIYIGGGVLFFRSQILDILHIITKKEFA